MIAINSDFLIDCLTLAAGANNEETNAVLRNVLDIYKETKSKSPDIIDKDLEVFFNIIKDIVESDVDLNKKAEINRVILKIKRSPLAIREPDLINQVSDLLNNSEELSEKRISSILHRVRQWVWMSKTSQHLRKMMFKCNKFDPSDNVNNEIIFGEVAEQARELCRLTEGGGSVSETIDVVDMTDPSSINRAYNAYKHKRSDNVFPTGLKGLNRMLGKHGGFRRGEFAAFAASSHNYKTGILMDCARWCTTLCSFKVPPGLTPCVVFISLENEVPENTWELMKKAYISAYKEAPPEDMSPEDLAKIVASYYNRHGVKFLMYRFDDMFGFEDYAKLITDLKNKNYCVIASIIDYITLMRIENVSDNPAKALQKLAQKIANFAKRNAILTITGLQLDSKADELNASGRTNIVREYGTTHLADAKGLKRELDILIFQKIELNQDEVPYLTMKWDKHRDETPPDKEDRYTAYRFSGPVLGIIEDYNTEKDYSVKDIYSDTSAIDGEEQESVI